MTRQRYSPIDAFDDLTKGLDVDDVAGKITEELRNADMSRVDEWLATLVDTCTNTEPDVAWTERDVSYGPVILRIRPTTGSPRALSGPSNDAARQVAEKWLSNTGTQIDIEVIETGGHATPTDVIRAIVKYKALHTTIVPDLKDEATRRMMEVNALLTKQAWFVAWVRHKAGRAG